MSKRNSAWNTGRSVKRSRMNRTNADEILNALRHNDHYRVLLNAPQELFEDKNFMLKAVSIDGELIAYASPQIKRDLGVVLKAVGRSDKAITHVPREMQDKAMDVWYSRMAPRLLEKPSEVAIMLRMLESRNPHLAAGLLSRLRRDSPKAYETIMTSISGYYLADDFEDELFEEFKDDVVYMKMEMDRNVDNYKLASDRVKKILGEKYVEKAMDKENFLEDIKGMSPEVIAYLTRFLPSEMKTALLSNLGRKEVRVMKILEDEEKIRKMVSSKVPNEMARLIMSYRGGRRKGKTLKGKTKRIR